MNRRECLAYCSMYSAARISNVTAASRSCSIFSGAGSRLACTSARILSALARAGISVNHFEPGNSGKVPSADVILALCGDPPDVHADMVGSEEIDAVTRANAGTSRYIVQYRNDDV
jgi:hypothetical protein